MPLHIMIPEHAALTEKGPYNTNEFILKVGVF